MKKLIALILFFLAAVIAFFELFALIDPVGLKAADDLDPFGNAHVPWYQHALLMVAILALAFVAWRIIRRDKKPKVLA
jgi:hypothetical protein